MTEFGELGVYLEEETALFWYLTVDKIRVNFVRWRWFRLCIIVSHFRVCLSLNGVFVRMKLLSLCDFNVI